MNHELFRGLAPSPVFPPSRPRECAVLLLLVGEGPRVCVVGDDLPEGFRDEVRRRRETPAGRFVLRLYKEERHI